MRAKRQGVNDGTSDDARDVIAAALSLEISEYDLFRIAYRRWYGAEGDKAFLERVFVDYLFRQRAPLWVRHYCRDVLRSDTTDWARFGIDDTVRRRPRPVTFGGNSFIVIGLAALLMSAVIFGLDGDRQSRPMSCQGGGPGLRFAENLAHAVSGRPDPVSCPEPYQR